jgi:hypothetical protein
MGVIDGEDGTGVGAPSTPGVVAGGGAATASAPVLRETVIPRMSSAFRQLE